MKRTLLALMALLMVATAALAVPAKPGQKRMLTLTDGSQVEAVLVGDEHGHYWQSADGRAFRMSARQDVFEETDAQAILQRSRLRRTKAEARRKKRMAPARAGEYGNYVGQKKGLVILVNFTDVTFKEANDAVLYNRIANEENFKEGNFVGSVHDYFYAQSGGLFDLTFDVVGPYQVANPQKYYGGNNREGDDEHPAEMIIEACQMADDDVNYADYDWDGDGEVDQVYVIYAGKGEADGGASYTIWPHEWDLESANYYDDGTGSIMLDDVKINTYACGCELNGNNRIDGIGTMCHEFSHCLGYPDFYDTGNGKGRGMDAWDLMDVGSYNGNGYQPAGYTSYERWIAGWREPIELGEEPLEVTGMKSLQDGGDFYIMYNEGHRDEYYLLENRQRTAWDAKIPGDGLLILHVDYNQEAWMDNTVNNSRSHQRMSWVAADNNYQTVSGYVSKAGMANDPFPYQSNNSFGNETKPAATLFNKNTDGSKLLNKIVYDIMRNDDGTISFKYKNEGAVDPEPIIPTGDGDYKRIVSVDVLTEEDSYLIVFEESATEGTAYAGINRTGSTHYGDMVGVTIDGYTISSEEARPVYLEKADDDNWYILDGDEYLYYNGTGNSLNATDSIGETGYKWSFALRGITNADYASLGRRLQYNNSSSGMRFACYTGTQQNVILYVKEGGREEKPDSEETDGIIVVRPDDSLCGDVYDLQGRRVLVSAGLAGVKGSNLHRGLYIRDGRKILIR